MNNDYYFEKCNNCTMMTYPFFFDKLKQIELLVDTVEIDTIESNCDICRSLTGYKLSNIIWSSKLHHMCNIHHRYPSEFFIKVILNTVIIGTHIINKPIELNLDKISHFNYIPLHYNKLLVLDALMKQGSWPRYEKDDANYIYSEHSGSLTIKNNTIDTIIIYTDTNRSDPNDEVIFLPNNTPDQSSHEYLFHTHPNTKKYAGRINEGIVYEFPSANDIFNFIKYHSNGKIQGSIIIAPEGTYIIRLINFAKMITHDKKFYLDLKKKIGELESEAIDKLSSSINHLSEADTFHKKVSSNFSYIDSYNKFIEPHNIYIEYYPREKKIMNGV